MCHLCNTKPVYEFTNKRKLCKNCFIHWFEKKFLYINRKFGMIKRGDVIVIKGNDYKNEVLKHILRNLKDKLMIKVDNKNINKTALTSTIDSEAEEIIQILINQNAKELKKLFPVIKDNKITIIKPLYLFLDEEVLLYAKLKNIKFKNKVKKDNKISEFINELEKKHPEVKRAVVNSCLKLPEK